MPSDAFVDRILKFEQQQQARESGQAGTTRNETVAEANARLAAENRERNEQLGIGGKTRARRAEADAALAREQLGAKAQALLSQAAAAYEEQSNWVEGPPDEAGWPTTINPAFEDATAKLIALGAPEYVDALAEHVGDPMLVDEIADMVEERDSLAAHARSQQDLAKRIASLREDSERLMARTQEILDLNPQFDPQHPDLVAEVEHHTAQARASDLEEDKRYHIERIKALEVESARRHQALEMATSVFSDWLTENAETGDFAQAEGAFIASLQMADASYEASIAAERRTSAVQAQANERGISEDSRTPEGKVVMTDGRSTYEVADEGVAPLLQSGFVPVREYVAEPEPDLEQALFPAPDPMAVAQEFADAFNQRDLDRENLERPSIQEVSRDMADAAAAAEEGRAQRDTSARLKETEQRLGGGS